MAIFTIEGITAMHLAAHDLVGNAFVGRGHDLVKHFGGILDPFLHVRLIFVLVGAETNGRREEEAAEREENFRGE
jgi:hypothetical protein